MKKSLAFLMPAALLLLFSCAKEMPVSEMEVTPAQEYDPWTVYPMTEVEALPGSHSAEAGFDSQTKSHLVLDGSHASVVWNAGDTFGMIGYITGSSVKIEYTNTSGAVDRATFYTNLTIPTEYCANKLHCVYPYSAIKAVNSIGDESAVRVTIPDHQTVTPGSADPAALIAYAQATAQNEDLHFQSAVSLIKFRVTGSAVGGVTSAAFRGTADAAGEFFLWMKSSTSTPSYVAGYSVNPSYSVSLDGSFSAGTDYYIAVAPSVHDGFMMTFTNSEGKMIKRISQKNLTLNRGQITDLGTIDIGSTFPDSDPSVIHYIKATAGAPKPVTIVVLSEGFQKTELDNYELQAKAGIDALFNTEPYKTYKNYFNVWIMKVASNQSGANITDGNGNIVTARDCYFGSKWGDGEYKDMSANPNKIFPYVYNNCPDLVNGTVSPNDVSILLIINDTRYGGICHNYGDGRNYCMVPLRPGTIQWKYMDSEAASVTAVPENYVTVSDATKVAEKLKNSGTWHNILVHEFGGHAIARLDDEYWDGWITSATPISAHNWTVPAYLNSSATYVQGDTPWSELFVSANQSAMADKSSLYANRISVFQGSNGSMFYRWRSEKISCMIDNRFYFSTWQRRLIVNRIMTLAGAAIPTFAEFLSHDVMFDPVRDGGSPTLLPEGLSNVVPPRPMPLLPSPVFHEE